MARNVVINNIVYQDVPKVTIPLSGSTGSAEFVDTSDATLASGNAMLSPFTSYANGVKFTGNIATKSGSDITASGDTVTVPAGYYSSQQTKAVASGFAKGPSSVSGTSASVSSGTNTLTLTKTVSITPVVTAGYVASGTATNASVSLTASVTTKAADTITPSTSNQEVASGTYLTGKLTVLGDSNLQSQYIKSGVSIFGTEGSLTSATVSQDATSKILSIS